MIIKRSLIAIVGVLWLSACNLTTYESEEQLALSRAGIETLVIEQEQGDLSIEVKQGLDEIEVEAELYATGEEKDATESFLKQNMMITLEKQGEEARLHSSVKQSAKQEQGVFG